MPLNSRPLKLPGAAQFLSAFLTVAVITAGAVAIENPARQPDLMAEKIDLGAKCQGVGVAGHPIMEHVPAEDFRADMELAASVGTDRYRLGANWREVEHTPGHYDWEALDERVNAVIDAGITPMLLLNTEPTWVDRADVPEHAEEFSAFAGAVAERYGSRVEGYEIWNEPNLDYYWQSPSADDYFEYLKRAYVAIHAKDPSATVMNGGPAPAANTETTVDAFDFIHRLYELGAKNYTDAIGVHPYSYPLLPSSDSKWNSFRVMERVRTMMADFGDGDKQFWSTEFGAPTGGLNSVSRAQQAAITEEAMDMMINDEQWGPLFLYTLRDTGQGSLDREGYFGLLTRSGQPKPVVNSISSALSRCNKNFEPGLPTGSVDGPDVTGSAGGLDHLPSQS